MTYILFIIPSVNNYFKNTFSSKKKKIKSKNRYYHETVWAAIPVIVESLGIITHIYYYYYYYYIYTHLLLLLLFTYIHTLLLLGKKIFKFYIDNDTYLLDTLYSTCYGETNDLVKFNAFECINKLCKLLGNVSDIILLSDTMYILP